MKYKLSNKLSNFKHSIPGYDTDKSITITSKISDIKKSASIGDLYDNDELHKNINSLCIKKVEKKSVGNVKMNKKVSSDICDCLFTKNQNLKLYELEKKVLNKEETPASECIKILDNYVAKNKSRKSRKSRKTRKSRKSRKSSKTRKSRK
jgi:hypothetical protein